MFLCAILLRIIRLSIFKNLIGTFFQDVLIKSFLECITSNIILIRSSHNFPFEAILQKSQVVLISYFPSQHLFFCRILVVPPIPLFCKQIQDLQASPVILLLIHIIYFHHFFFFIFSCCFVATFSHRRSARIKNLI